MNASGLSELPDDTMKTSTMTIDDCKSLFDLYGSELEHDYASIVSVIRADEDELAVKNSNFLHALMLTKQMYRRTRQDFKMVTGGWGDSFIRCLLPQFKDMLLRLRENGGVARVIVLDGDREGYSDLLREFGVDDESIGLKKVLEVKTGKTKPGHKVNHSIICDTTMVRIEEPHDPVSGDFPADKIKADVYFHNRVRNATQTNAFEGMWGVLKPSTT